MTSFSEGGNKIVSDLMADIAFGRLKPKDKLPSERQLANTYSASRSTAREALAKLEASGLTTKSAGRVSCVNNLLDVVHDEPSLTLEKAPDKHAFLCQLMEARAMLESQAAYFAASRATDTELEELASTYAAMVALSAHDDVLARAKVDLMFHSTIAKISHNLFVVSFSDIFYTRYFNVIYEVLSNNVGQAGRYPDGIAAQHREIFDAIMNRQADQASEKARNHMLHTLGILRALKVG